MATVQNQPRIKLLPSHLIDQIKAGEVIERPSMLLKELLENAIDAKSTCIDIHLRQNGMELMKVQDNGVGMSFEELPLAFTRHATSKLSTFEDLYSLHSFGFRGEALASAASIARLSCLSVPIEDLNNGGQIQWENGAIQRHLPHRDSSSGTVLFVRDLFFNTPVRLKFIKGQVGEKNALKKIIKSFLLAFPNIRFTIQWDDQEKEVYLPTDNQLERFLLVCGLSKKNEHAGQKISLQYDGLSLELMVVNLSSKKIQALFANGRYFEHYAFHKFLQQKLQINESAISYAAFIQCPTSFIDPNVHPNKIHLKFQEEAKIFALLGAAIDQWIKSQSIKISIQNGIQSSSFSPHTERPDFSNFFKNDLPKEVHEEDRIGIQNDRPFLPTMLIRESTVSLFFQKIGPYFFSFSKEKNSLTMIHETHAFTQLWIHTYHQTNGFDSEETICPLIVARPIDLNEQHHMPPFPTEILEKLKTLGLEISLMGETFFLLKAMPRSFVLLGLEDACQEMTHFILSNWYKMQKKTAIEMLEEFILWPGEKLIHLQLTTEQISAWPNSGQGFTNFAKGAKDLKEERLHQLYNEAAREL